MGMKSCECKSFRSPPVFFSYFVRGLCLQCNAAQAFDDSIEMAYSCSEF